MNLYNELMQQVKAKGDPWILSDVRAAVPRGTMVRTFFVRPQTLFDKDSVYDSLTCFIVTSSDLIIVASDVSYEFATDGELLTSVQHVPLAHVQDFQVLRRRALDGADAGAVRAIGMRLRWGGAWGIDTFPAACDDPNCQADHGFVGRVSSEDAEIFVDLGSDPVTFAEGAAFISQVQGILTETIR